MSVDGTISHADLRRMPTLALSPVPIQHFHFGSPHVKPSCLQRWTSRSGQELASQLSSVSKSLARAGLAHLQTSQYMLLIRTAAWKISIRLLSVSCCPVHVPNDVSGLGKDASKCRMVLFSESCWYRTNTHSPPPSSITIR